MKPLSESQIIRGDCVATMEGWPAGGMDLVFADPPFNIGYKYKGYDDALKYEDYVAWTKRWMAACVRVLKEDGSFYIAIGDAYAAEVRIIGRELGLTLRNWIIWQYNFGQNTRAKFALSHTHIFYFTRDEKNFTFNDAQIRYPSARHTEYGDRRAHPLGRVPDDVWSDFPRVCGTFKERQGWHGCQMPEALLARIIRVSSNPGEIVLDPFSGSGTTVAAATRLGRIGIGIDLGEEFAAEGERRLSAVKAECDIPADEYGWTEQEREVLKQLYRETATPCANLLANEAAMTCFANCLIERTGSKREIADVTAELERLGGLNQLPKLKNDRPYRPHEHRKEHAADRKLSQSWFTGLSPTLKQRNERGLGSTLVTHDTDTMIDDPATAAPVARRRKRGKK